MWSSVEEDRDGLQTEDWKRVFEGWLDWLGRAEWDLLSSRNTKFVSRSLKTHGLFFRSCSPREGEEIPAGEMWGEMEAELGNHWAALLSALKGRLPWSKAREWAGEAVV